jgi:hypothetical protein
VIVAVTVEKAISGKELLPDQAGFQGRVILENGAPIRFFLRFISPLRVIFLHIFPQVKP